MQSRLIGLILLLSPFLNIKTQNLEERLRLNVSESTVIDIDNLGNIYNISREGKIVKRDFKGRVIQVNSPTKYGSANLIEAKDPLKPLLFYKDYGRIQILDQKLSIKSEIDLNSLGVFNAASIAYSSENNYWVYDLDQQQLKKYSQQFKLISESMDLRQILDKELSPIQIQEANNAIYVLDAENGIYIFDQFGKFEKRIPFNDCKYFHVDGDLIYYIDNSFFHIYHQKSLQSVNLLLNELNKNSLISIQGKRLILLNKNKLVLYQIVL